MSAKCQEETHAGRHRAENSATASHNGQDTQPANNVAVSSKQRLRRAPTTAASRKSPPLMCAAPESNATLLQRIIDRSELGVQLCAKAVNDSDDGERNASR